MNKEKIEKAAIRHANMMGWDHDPEEVRGLFALSFKEGARWRMDSVWHDPDRSLPDCDKTVIVEFERDGERGHAFSHRSDNPDVITDSWGFCFYVKKAKITRWAYMEDLLPDRKETAQ